MKKNKEIKLPSNKSFGMVFFVVFLIGSFYPLINSDSIRIWSMVISMFFLVLGLLNSRILTPLNKLWFKFGILLGKIVSPFILGIIFFLVVTPVGLIMRILGKDVLNLKYNNSKSYWIEQKGPKSKMKNQF